MNRQVKKLIINSMLIIMAVATVIPDSMLGEFDLGVVITHIIFGLLSIVNINLSWRHSFSFYKIHGYFMYIFMFLAAMYQYNSSAQFWQGGVRTVSERFYGNILLILWIITYMLIYEVSYRLRQRRNDSYLASGGIAPGKEPISYNLGKFRNSLFLLVLAGIVLAYVMNEVGFMNLLSRGTRTFTIESSALAVTVSRLVNYIPAIAMLFYLNYVLKSFRLNRKVKGFEALVLLALVTANLLANFPLSLARFMMAAIYIPMILIISPKLIGKNFDLLLMGGIFFVFPALNFFRHASIDAISSFKLTSNDFNLGDFDTYTMLLNTVRYTRDFGLTWGRQLSGLLLFFVPRVMWENKPIGSGFLIGQTYKFSLYNISCPLPAEGYIDFGIPGLVIYAVLYAMLCSYMDSKYWLVADRPKSYLFEILYLVLMTLSFFNLRGDMLSGGAFVTAAIIVWLFCSIALRLMNGKDARAPRLGDIAVNSRGAA